jgi:hypothetical protein
MTVPNLSLVRSPRRWGVVAIGTAGIGRARQKDGKCESRWCAAPVGDDRVGRAYDHGRGVVIGSAVLPTEGCLARGVNHSVRGIQFVERVWHVGDILIAPERMQGRDGFVDGGTLEPHQLAAGMDDVASGHIERSLAR